ncbi:unnamed protein product [Lactuca saligna]|uniref:PRA1 family protein n=1 Tax=Lactuca saligna TaxID=75948 RepID=A0AA35Y2A5_LACSI|nr:unnamed protein product [Lactuca saligna]
MTTYGTIPTSSGGGTNLEYLSRAKARIKSGLGTRRSWKEMFNFRSVDLPHGVSDAFSRIKINIGYFRMNYAILVLVILFLSLLWHPVSLIVFVVMMAAWLFLYFLRDEPLTMRQVAIWHLLRLRSKLQFLPLKLSSPFLLKPYLPVSVNCIKPIYMLFCVAFICWGGAYQ